MNNNNESKQLWLQSAVENNSEQGCHELNYSYKIKIIEQMKMIK